MIADPVSSNVQRIYDEVVFKLSPAERLQLIELLNQSVAVPAPAKAAAAAELPLAAAMPQLPGWHITERRGGQSEWRDRAL